MKILFIDTTNHWDEVGGGHTYLPGLMRRLVQRGHDVHLVTQEEPNPILTAPIRDSGASVHERPWGNASIVEDSVDPFTRWVHGFSPDAYLISGSNDIGWVALPHLNPSIATFMTAHNDSETFYQPLRHYKKFLTRAVGVSDTICRKYVDECGMASDRVDWIPYGVETLSSFDANVSRVADRPDSERPIKLAYVGRFENTQKRIDDIVAVAQRLAAEGVAFEFDLIGDGEAMPDVRAELSGLLDRDVVRIHGWLPSDQVIQKLRESEVFVLASAYEGFCISLIESMANGCVPVVTDIESGNKQLVNDGVNGFVVPVGDVDAFVDRIKALAGNRKLLREMRERAWQTGREYSIDRMVESYERCFEAAIEDTRLNPRTPDPDFPLMESCRSRYPLWMRRLKAKAKALVTT